MKIILKSGFEYKFSKIIYIIECNEKFIINGNLIPKQQYKTIFIHKQSISNLKDIIEQLKDLRKFLKIYQKRGND